MSAGGASNSVFPFSTTGRSFADVAAKLRGAREFKEEGNRLFKEGNFKKALVSYRKVRAFTRGLPGSKRLRPGRDSQDSSMLGMASGIVAGLVAITPAAGFAGPVGAIILGLIVSPVCLIFCSIIKNALKYDDSLDAFGIHGVGGIIGAIGTGILVSPDLGGAGLIDWSKCAHGTAGALGACDALPYVMTDQVIAQLKGVAITVVWSGIASTIVWFVVKILTGGRVKTDVEEEGIDINEHGEAAYHP